MRTGLRIALPLRCWSAGWAHVSRTALRLSWAIFPPSLRDGPRARSITLEGSAHPVARYGASGASNGSSAANDANPREQNMFMRLPCVMSRFWLGVRTYTVWEEGVEVFRFMRLLR